MVAGVDSGKQPENKVGRARSALNVDRDQGLYKENAFGALWGYFLILETTSRAL